MLGYQNQKPAVLFSAVTLDGTYANNLHELNVGGFSKLSLDIDYAMGAAETANVLHFKIEHSPDEGVTWYSLPIDSTGTTSELTARVWEITGTLKLNVLVDIAYDMIRVSMIESGVAVNAGTASMTATLSGI